MRKRTYRSRAYFLFLLIGLSLLTGCGSWIDDETMETFFESDVPVNTFYGECVISQYMNDELLCDIKFNEWKGKEENYRIEIKYNITDKYKEEVDNGRIKEKLESGKEIDVSDGKQLTAYIPETDTYYIKPISLADEVIPFVLPGINQVLQEGGLKDCVLKTINDISKTHDVSIEDNVSLNGYTTQHLIAKPKEGKETEGYLELWIDQDTWMIIKTKQVIGNYTNISEYKDFEINKKIDEKKFIMTIPKGAKVVKLNEKLEEVNKEVSLEEATKLLDLPIMYLKENNYTRLKHANYIEVSNELYAKVQLTYLVEGKEVIVRTTPSNALQQSIDFGYEKVDVNDIEGIYVEDGAIKLVEFVKDDILCDIYVKNSEMTKEGLIYWASKLEVFNK